MTNKSLACIMAVSSLMFASCSSDEANSTDAFFNLNVGSKWAYKRYDSNTETPNYVYTGIIDTVEVTGTQLIDGLEFAVLEHRKHNENSLAQTTAYEYLRVDENGHLTGISTPTSDPENIDAASAAVLHPGMDSSYQNTVTNDIGTIVYQIFAPEPMTVEGIEYQVLPYKGFFTNANPSEPSKTIEFDYAAHTGRVLSRCHAVLSPYSWEERLVWHELAN